MPKRHREGDRDETGVSLSKRQRQSPRYHLSSLSDELLLKILAELPLNSLTLCQRYAPRHPQLAIVLTLFTGSLSDFIPSPGILSCGKRNTMHAGCDLERSGFLV